MDFSLFETTKEIKPFTKKCLMNEAFRDYDGSIKIIKGYWNKSKSVNEFKEMVLNDTRLAMNQGYAELSKECPNHWERVRTMLGNNFIETMSDIGSVKIGTDEFSTLVSNGYGDGITHVAIVELDSFNKSMVNFDTVVQGKFNIYSYDCGNDIVTTLEGKYGIYYYDGIVIFERWK